MITKIVITEFIVHIINSSYYIFTIFAIICAILYVLGFKKVGKYIGLSFAIYFLLQCVKVAIK